VLGYWIDFSFGFTFSGIIRDIAKDRACFGLGVEMVIGLGNGDWIKVSAVFRAWIQFRVIIKAWLRGMVTVTLGLGLVVGL
jgi:hypothetical protein